MKNTSQNRTAILIFTLPSLVLFTAIVSIPIFNTFYRSLFQWDGLSTPVFIGIQNYIELFHDDIFHTSLKNGLIYAAILLTYQVGLSSLLAFLFSIRNLAGSRLMRTTLFIPVVLSVTVVCQLWLSVLNGEYGLLNKLFEALDLSYRQDWLSGGNSAIVTIAFVDSWQNMGYYLVLIYTAMKSIPEQLYEAAEIDGASTFFKHFKITIPLLVETYKLCFILTITGGMKAFSCMYIMTRGGPGTITYTLTYLMYRSAFRVNEFGYACTSASFLVVECILVTILINKLFAKDGIQY